MKIGLLGMSGIGKTFWATQLTAVGFECFHCDDMIAAQLQAEVEGPMDDVYDMGNWMGFPYEEGFCAKESRYIALEKDILTSLAHTLLLPHYALKKVVVDMTGSAIYAGEEVFTHLRQSLILVYLALTPDVHQQMLQEYVHCPRPLIWQGLFKKSPDETNEIGLKRSYARLIAYRQKLYEQFCDVQIEYSTHRQSRLTVEGWLQIIQTATNTGRSSL